MSGHQTQAENGRAPAPRTLARATASVKNWPRSGWQIDSRFPDYLGLVAQPAGESNAAPDAAVGPICISRRRDLGDSIMLLIALAPLGTRPIQFTELGRLRVQECERVAALRTELTRCGAQVIETGDTLMVHPSSLHGAEIVTYNDHRMAMCFAILGLKLPGITLQNPACVKKTFPNFFQKLAAPPPAGLGATIREARTGRPLAPDELFAA